MSSGLNGLLIKPNSIPIPALSGVTGNGKYVGTDISGNVGVFNLPSASITTLYGNTLFVTKNGDNGTALKGRLDLPYLTVQSAINIASSDDTIIVYGGTYTETLTISSKNLTFLSAGKTIFEGNHSFTSSNIVFDNIKLKNTSGINFSVASSNIRLKNSEMETNLTYHTSAIGTSSIYSNNLITNNNLTNGTYTTDEPFMHIINTTFTI